MSVRALWAISLVVVIGACGGRAATAGDDTSTGATAGSRQANGGSGNAGGNGNAGGSAHGGQNNAGTGNVGQVCCGAVPECPAGYRQLPSAADCPTDVDCKPLTICCSTIWCMADSVAVDAGAGMRVCGTELCDPQQQACVASRVEGGVFLPPDAGTCPTGEHLVGSQCERDFSYQCVDLGGACAGEVLSCACAKNLCPGEFDCSDPSQSDDVANGTDLVCQELVP